MRYLTVLGYAKVLRLMVVNPMANPMFNNKIKTISAPIEIQ